MIFGKKEKVKVEFVDWNKFFKRQKSRTRKLADYWYEKMWSVYCSDDNSAKANRLYAKAYANFMYYSARLGDGE